MIIANKLGTKKGTSGSLSNASTMDIGELFLTTNSLRVQIQFTIHEDVTDIHNRASAQMYSVCARLLSSSPTRPCVLVSMNALHHA